MYAFVNLHMYVRVRAHGRTHVHMRVHMHARVRAHAHTRGVRRKKCFLYRERRYKNGQYIDSALYFFQ